jgi:hypothetical protein
MHYTFYEFRMAVFGTVSCHDSQMTHIHAIFGCSRHNFFLQRLALLRDYT